VLGVDERRDAAVALGTGHGVQGDGGLARRLGTVDLDDPAAWQAADAERRIQGDGARGDGLDGRPGLVTETHDRTLAVLLVDLGECSF